MPEMTLELIEETLRKEVQKIDKSVQVVAVEKSKKKDFYRVTLLKDGKTGSAELKKTKASPYRSVIVVHRWAAKGPMLARPISPPPDRSAITVK